MVVEWSRARRIHGTGSMDGDEGSEDEEESEEEEENDENDGGDPDVGRTWHSEISWQQKVGVEWRK